MRRFEKFFKQIAELRSVARGSKTKQIKKLIGDSTSNNRTLTVRQAIRYLDIVGLDSLATQIDSVRPLIEHEIVIARSNRTDAIDLSEFVNTYRNVVMNGKKLRTKVGAALRKG
jgi:hypothetical protein